LVFRLFPLNMLLLPAVVVVVLPTLIMGRPVLTAFSILLPQMVGVLGLLAGLRPFAMVAQAGLAVAVVVLKVWAVPELPRKVTKAVTPTRGPVTVVVVVVPVQLATLLLWLVGLA
jgi:hypothetical protein